MKKQLILGLTLGMLLGSSTAAVAATSSTVQAALAKFNVVVGKQNQQLASNQLVYNGNTYVQLREAGAIFGYNVTYNGTSKTITFTPANDWLTLSQITELTDLAVDLDPNKKDSYRLLRGKDVIVSFDAQDLVEHEEKAAASSTNNKVIYFTKVNGAIMINSEDLKEAGLL